MGEMQNHYEVAMRRAIVLAAQGQGRTGANPVVGAVIIDSDGTIISDGSQTAAISLNITLHMITATPRRL